jgi:hypothetical protein
MFGVPGLQVGVLRRLQRFNGGWRAPVIGLELDGEFAAADVDVLSADRPTLVQPGVDADDLSDRPLVPDRMANDTPRASWRWRSSAVL